MLVLHDTIARFILIVHMDQVSKFTHFSSNFHANYYFYKYKISI